MFKTVFPYVVIVILSLLLFNECNNKPKEQVKIPFIFEFSTPEYKGKSDTIRQDSIIYITETLPSETDTLLLKYLQDSEDSIKRLNMFINAITIREYNETFKDSIQEVCVYSKTRGNLIEQAITYTIFPKTYKIDTVLIVDIPIKSQKYLNLGVGYGLITENPTLHGSFIFINKKSQLYELGASSNSELYFKYGFKF